jgi:hypothetical protein
MKKLILLNLGLLGIISCSSGIEGEGAATANKEFPIENFTSLDIECNCELTLIPAPTTKVVVESHQNLIDNLVVELKGKDLEIKENTKVSSADLYNVIVYFNPELTEIELNNQAKMKVSGTLKAEKFAIEVNDQSNIQETFVEVTDMKLDISDQTMVNLTGTIINLDLKSSDESKADLTGTQAVDVKFSASGNSQLSLYPMKNLSGKATDNSEVYYKGDPKKDTTEKDKAKIQQQ